MAKFVVAPAAERDMESILRWTDEHFGETARIRYEALLIQAINDVADRPDRIGSERRSELTAAARTYHLFHSRMHVPTKTGRIARPRHFLLYRKRADGVIEIGRVLHDSVDLARHLPDEFRTRSGNH